MGVPPSPATKLLLEQGLNVVGNVVKTSKYKFHDWNIKLPKGTTKLPEAEFKKLSRAATFFREGHYTREDIKKIQDAAKEAKTKVKEAEKLAKESKNLWDKFLSKAKGGSLVAKAASAGGTVAKAGDALIKLAPIFTALVAIGISVGVNHIQGWRNDVNEDGQQLLSQSISKVLGLMNAQKQRIDRANEGLKKAELENQRVKDRVYGLEKQQPAIRDSIADAKKKSNDALYEIRTGKVKLEADIASAKKKSNDALYETRTGRTKLEDKIAQVQSQINKFTQGATSNFQSKIEVTIGIIQGRLNTTESKVANLEKTKPTLQDKVIQTIQDSVKKVSTDLAPVLTKLAQLEKVPAQVQALQSQVKTIEVEHPKRWGITVTQAEVRQATITKSTDSATRTYVERRLAKVTESQFSATEWVGRYGAKTANLVDNGVDSLRKNDEVLAGGIAAVATDTNQRIQQLENRNVVVLSPEVNTLSRKIKDLEIELEQTKLNDKKLGTILNDLNVKVKEQELKVKEQDIKVKQQEKVNQSAIPKLDQILGILPFIPARTADVIRPSIATIPQIEQAAATGTCRTLQPGGCGANALNGLGNGINQNTNNQSNNLFDKLNLGANAAQMGLLQIMDNKLGNQLPGGLSGTFGRLWKTLQVDRVLNILILISTFHNALMLSNNLGQTLFSAIDNISKAVGFKWTDEKGEEKGFGSLVSDWTTNFFKTLFGVENYTALVTTYKKANRIYQAAANLLNSVQSIGQSTLSALEVLGSWNAKVGNALRKFGEVGEKAYGWMNPQPNFQNKFFTGLETTQNVISQIDSIASEVLSVQDTIKQFGDQKKELDESLKQSVNSKQGKEAPEAEKLKEAAIESKEESKGVDILDSDKEADEDTN